jgi:hypothetical protein
MPVLTLHSPDKGHMSGKVGFVFGAASLVSVIWVYFRVPETANRGFDELDIMFDRKVPARKFESYICTI